MGVQTAEAASRRPHLVVLPVPTRGHVNPMMHFSKILAAQGVSITFVNSEYNDKLVVDAEREALLRLGIRMEALPDGLPAHIDRTTYVLDLCKVLVSAMSQPFEALLARLLRQQPTPSCILADTWLTFTVPAASKFGLPHANFWTQSAASFASLLMVTNGSYTGPSQGEAEKDPMEGTFGSPVDGFAHSQAGSSRKPDIDSMCGGGADKNESQKQASEDTQDQQKAEKRAEKRDVVGAQGDASKESGEVPLKPEPAMNKDVEDAEKSSEKPIEKDTTVNLSDEDVDLYISNFCAEILGNRKKRSNNEERATPNKKAKVASELAKPISGGKKTKEPSSAQKRTNLQARNLKPPKPKSRKKLL